MLFNSYSFIFVFLPITWVVFYVLSKKSTFMASSWLALVSLFFYAYWSLQSLPILIISIVVNYIFGYLLRAENTKSKKIVLSFSIGSNLIALMYFKYTNFLIDNINSISTSFGAHRLDLLSLSLPIGISFFTFTQIAFLIDSYDGKVREKNFTHYLLFVTFFPHLIAGPIIHHNQMMPQFARETSSRLNVEKITIGISLFTLGLAKKLLLADVLSGYADLLFENVKTGFIPKLLISWFGSLSYSFQLYFDFSGYSDMALGLSLIFGILLPLNFNSPFKSTNIINFWQRWHISLTAYIGQYLYTPLTLKFTRLGSGKNAAVESLFSLILPTLCIFLLIGIWHGPSWNYVLFGGIHGVLIVINHLWRRRKFWVKMKKKQPSRFGQASSWFLTFISVNAAFVMFRSDSIRSAMQIYRGMMGINGIALPTFFPDSFITTDVKGVWQNLAFMGSQSSLSFLSYLIFSFIVILALPSTATLTDTKSKNPKYVRYLQTIWAPIVLSIIFIMSVLQLGKTSAFLYFQF